jgi:hypothetical protein
MKIIITESQYRRLIEQEEPEVLHIPSFKYFNNDWNFLQEYLESEGNPPYTIDSDLNLYASNIKSLGNLQSVGGDLDLSSSDIESLGNLQSVGGDLDLQETPLSEKYSEEEIREMVQVGGDIYM